jgi:hypothetical protein
METYKCSQGFVSVKIAVNKSVSDKYGCAANARNRGAPQRYFTIGKVDQGTSRFIYGHVPARPRAGTLTVYQVT